MVMVAVNHMILDDNADFVDILQASIEIDCFQGMDMIAHIKVDNF